MAHLKSLTFTVVHSGPIEPKLIRRQRLIARLEEQRRLFNEPTFAPVKRKWTKLDDGRRIAVEEPRRLKPWWRTDPTGNVVLTVKAGLKPLEFEKGKAGIAVGSLEKLDSVFSTLIAAIRAGELDGALEAVKRNGPPKGRKAA